MSQWLTSLAELHNQFIKRSNFQSINDVRFLTNFDRAAEMGAVSDQRGFIRCVFFIHFFLFLGFLFVDVIAQEVQLKKLLFFLFIFNQ